MKLNVGAGRDIREGWVNADIAPLPGIAPVFDIDEMPWPWPDDRFDAITARSVIEHARDKMPFIEEMWRVAKHNCDIIVTSCPATAPDAWADPTHRSPMHWQTFDFFVPGHPYSYYSRARFIAECICCNAHYLEWHLRAYKRPDPDLLALQVDTLHWKGNTKGEKITEPKRMPWPGGEKPDAQAPLL